MLRIISEMRLSHRCVCKSSSAKWSTIAFTRTSHVCSRYSARLAAVAAAERAHLLFASTQFYLCMKLQTAAADRDAFGMASPSKWDHEHQANELSIADDDLKMANFCAPDKKWESTAQTQTHTLARERTTDGETKILQIEMITQFTHFSLSTFRARHTHSASAQTILCNRVAFDVLQEVARFASPRQAS